MSKKKGRKVIMAKTYKNKTKPEEVETIEEVVVTISEPTTKERDVSIQQLQDERAREVIHRDTYIASIADYDVMIAAATLEAGKVALRTPK